MLISILLRQIAIMALLAAVGVYLSRKGFLSPQGTKDLGAILLRVIIPCVIVKSYITEFSRERLLEYMMSTDAIANDVGTVLDGPEAVACGLIDSLGTLSDALAYLHGEIEKNEE